MKGTAKDRPYNVDLRQYTNCNAVETRKVKISLDSELSSLSDYCTPYTQAGNITVSIRDQLIRGSLGETVWLTSTRALS
jgi:hypothetical protein